MASRAAAVNNPLPAPSGPVDLWIFNLCLFIMLRFRLLTTSWSMDDAEPPVSSSSLSSELRSIGKEIKVLLGPALPGRAMNLLAGMPPPTHHPDLQHSHQQLVQLCRQLLWRWVKRLPGPFPLHQGPSDFFIFWQNMWDSHPRRSPHHRGSSVEVLLPRLFLCAVWCCSRRRSA